MPGPPGCATEALPDTQRYLAALDILREADLDGKALDGCSLLHGLESYSGLLEGRSYLDYSAILEAAVDVLTNDQLLRERIRERVRCVIVDEYQDVNPIQEAIVWSLHELGANVCVVGDDDQTIYQWRGSDVQNILNFSSRYPLVVQIALEGNFRSSSVSDLFCGTYVPVEEPSTASQPDSCSAAKQRRLFDHLVGAGDQCR